ncbi:TPA: hypothetical protein WGQ52_000074 [Neisseria meningitidis]
MFAVFGKCRSEEEKRWRLVYNKDDSTWYEDQRKWTRLSNSCYQISPEYSTIDTAEEFVRLLAGNPDIHIVEIRQAQEVNGRTVWKPVKTVLKGSKNANSSNKTDGKPNTCRQAGGEEINAARTRHETRRNSQKR